MVFDNIFEPHNWALVPFHFWSLVFFVFGCMIGSFLNVCIYRMPLDLSVVSPPSHCPHCKYAIPFYLNVPLLTWLDFSRFYERSGVYRVQHVVAAQAEAAATVASSASAAAAAAAATRRAPAGGAASQQRHREVSPDGELQ